MPATKTPTYIEVGQDIAAAFDQYVEEQRLERKLKKQAAPHEKSRKEAADILKAATEEGDTLKLPDGRFIKRTDDVREVKAKKAYSYPITTFAESPA